MEEFYGKQNEDEQEEQTTVKNKKSAYDEKEDKKVKTNIWTEEQDNILIDNYDQFKALGSKICVEFLA